MRRAAGVAAAPTATAVAAGALAQLLHRQTVGVQLDGAVGTRHAVGRALRLRLARRLRATSTSAATARALAGLVLADALHHLLARGLGGGGHHLAARRAAQAAPQRLAAHGDGLGALAFLGAKAVQHAHGNLLLGEALDLVHEAFLVHAHQAHCLAAVAGAAGAADAVHVVFGHVGNVVVDDVRQLVDVDAACRNIGSNQGAQIARLELGQRLGAGALALVAVQRHGLDALVVQKVGHLVGAELGAREHQYLAPVVFADQVRQYVFLAVATHGVDHLRDALHRGVGRRDLHALRVLQQVARQFADFVAEGGAEEQALLVLGQQRQHLLHVVDEAHVEHAVGLVQHQNFDVREVDVVLAFQIEQTARRGDQDVDAARDAVDLRVHADAAEDHGGSQLQVLAVGANGFLDLRRQLARGRQHQRADGARFGCRARAEQLQHGQREAGRLAGAGLCAGQQVVATQHHGNGLRLDGGGGRVALLLHRAQDGGGQVQFVKVHQMDAPVSRRGELLACSGGCRPVVKAAAGSS